MSPASGLPEAGQQTRQWFADWLERFAGFVRDVDYASARPLFHEQILAFGTHSDVIPGLQSWIDTQWDNVWPRTTDFCFDLSSMRVLVSVDETMATVVVPWTSTGYSKGGEPFDRPGRATLVFNRVNDGWLCAHSHMSLNRGVPQESHASRTVKSR